MKLGDKVKVDTIVNGWLSGNIVCIKEALGFKQKIYCVKYDETCGPFINGVVEEFLEERMKPNE